MRPAAKEFWLRDAAPLELRTLACERNYLRWLPFICVGKWTSHVGKMALLLTIGIVWTAITITLIGVRKYRWAVTCPHYMALAGITFLYMRALSGFSAIGRHIASDGFAQLRSGHACVTRPALKFDVR